jgi:hypothetical protein
MDKWSRAGAIEIELTQEEMEMVRLSAKYLSVPPGTFIRMITRHYLTTEGPAIIHFASVLDAISGSPVANK